VSALDLGSFLCGFFLAVGLCAGAAAAFCLWMARREEMISRESEEGSAVSAPIEQLTDEAILAAFEAATGRDLTILGEPHIIDGYINKLRSALEGSAGDGLERLKSWSLEEATEFRERCGVYDLPKDWFCARNDGGLVLEEPFSRARVEVRRRGARWTYPIATFNVDDRLTIDDAEALATVLQIAAREARRRAESAKAAGLLVEGEALP